MVATSFKSFICFFLFRNFLTSQAWCIYFPLLSFNKHNRNILYTYLILSLFRIQQQQKISDNNVKVKQKQK